LHKLVDIHHTDYNDLHHSALPPHVRQSRTIYSADLRRTRGAEQNAGPASGFEVLFVGFGGQLVQQQWTDAAATVAFEELEPVLPFPAPCRPWEPGRWWSATTMRTLPPVPTSCAQLLVLDRDPTSPASPGGPCGCYGTGL
ncbi:hypothetical protein ACFYP3_36860, partial [Streptomyces sp. NPDC005533]